MSSVKEYLLARTKILTELEQLFPEKSELERLTIHLIEVMKSKKQSLNETGDGYSKVERAWQLYKLAGGKEDRLITFFLKHKEYF